MSHDRLMTSLHTRRQFCARSLASAAAIGVLGPLCAACSSPTSPSNLSSLPLVNATQTGNVHSVTIADGSTLAAVGALALVQSPSHLFLVAHTAVSSFTALSAICTHQTCEITAFSGGTFVCPCHGSQFDTSGHVLGGPAPSPLTQYPTQFVNNVLSITA